MRNVFLGSFFLLSIAAPVSLSASDPVLWYQHPAQKWGDALPVGNGRLGGMVFGGIAKEHIQLNEDTIWNGKKRDRVNPEALKALPEVRRLLFAGKPREAEALEEKALMGIPNRQPPYQPLGDLNIEFSGQDNAVDYRRELNLATGIVRITYRIGDATCKREVFSSAPDQVLVVHMACDNRLLRKSELIGEIMGKCPRGERGHFSWASFKVRDEPKAHCFPWCSTILSRAITSVG
jgi:alpha-L-fucosidase 2